MRISDWSSDVCSSDLKCPRDAGLAGRGRQRRPDRKGDGRRDRRVGRGGIRYAGPCGRRHDISGKSKVMSDRIAEAAKLAPSASLTVEEVRRSEEHTSELQSLMRISYAVFCLKKKNY